VLIFASGAAALIYEMAWFQMLELITGSSALAIAILLGTFMGGMCVGSLALPRIVAPQRPLQVYAMVELGIALCAVMLLLLVAYVHGALRATIVLLPPTILMGATLPAVSRWVESTQRGVSWLGFFYAANTAGAVFGSLLAGFYLLRVYDITVSTYAAAVINIVVALAALLFGRNSATNADLFMRGDSCNNRGLTPNFPEYRDRPRSPNSVYLAIALSGFCALGAEVVWTRLLSLILGASVYTFSIIVAIFLLGLGLGSCAGAALSRWTSNPRRDLGLCQALLAVAITWSAYMLTRVLPYWSLDTTQLHFQSSVLRTMLAVLPAACLWGASVPLALAAAAKGQDPGRLVSGIYAANTVGAITAAVGFSLLVIPHLGTQHAQQILIAVSSFAALAVLPRSARTAAASAVLLFTVSPVPPGLIAYGPKFGSVLSQNDAATIIYSGEGVNSSIAVSENFGGFRNFHVSGKIEASTQPQDMRIQRMLGHLPALLHERPRSVLVVGFGAGVTAGSFVMHPTVERIVICEIEPLIPKVVGKYFSEQNYNVFEDPRVQIVYDDARHFLLTTEEKFDVITSDPIHPWVKGSAALYTKEYFELVRRHLTPGGVVSQWVPLYQSSADVVKSELATFFGAFPGGTVWTNNRGRTGFDIVLLGRESRAAFDNESLDKLLNRRDHFDVVGSLSEVGFASAIDLLATYLADGHDLWPWLVDAQINQDRNLRLQYLAGMGMNRNDAVLLLQSIASYRPARELDSKQVEAISRTLSSIPPRRISITVVTGNPEALEYAHKLRRAIAAGGWDVESVREVAFTNRVTGLHIRIATDPAPTAENQLLQALGAARLKVVHNFDPTVNPDAVQLIVGGQY
jgi:spermidine synthase